MNTSQLLNDLYDKRVALENLTGEMHDATEAVIPTEVKQAITDIEASFREYHDAISTSIAEIEAKIKAAVIADGSTVRGRYLQAVYVNGRVSWDDKALSGYMVDHPELARFRTTGKPSVTIRSTST